MDNVIDELLATTLPDGGDPTLRAGLRAGQDLKALSEKADTGILDELFSQGEHKSATVRAARTGLVSADPNWRSKQADTEVNEHTYDAKPHTVDDIQDGLFKDASAKDPLGLETLGKQYIDDGKIKRYISDQLTLGKTPAQVVASLQKLAAGAIFDNTMTDEYLKDQSGLLGLSYIEPNQFNRECKASLKHIQAHGTLRAASVKAIPACEGCVDCKRQQGGALRCAVYQRPIVRNAKELGHVVAALSGGSMKRAALVDRHNAVTPQNLPGHQANIIASRPAPVVRQQTAGGGKISSYDPESLQQAAGGFTPKNVTASIAGGATFAAVFAEAKRVHGSHTAERVCRAYLDSLKGSGARVNLASIDCSLLTRRLSSTEAILGAAKCAGCSLRGGMHCGKTGGTLLSFPGMERDPQAKKTAAVAPSQGPDAVQFMASLGMMQNQDLTIEMKAPRQLLDVEL